MSCREAIDLMDVALDGTLHDRSDFEGHLAECGPCRRYYLQLGATVRTLGQLTPPRIANPRRAELLEQFRKSRRNP